MEVSEVLLRDLEFSGRIDSEYYQPMYIKKETEVRSHGYQLLKDIADFKIGPFGSAFTVDNYTDKQKYRYIRGKDVKEAYLKSDDNVYMPEEDYKRLKKYELRKNDILVSVVGTIGNAAIVNKEVLPAIFSCKSTAITAKKINSIYLLIYLNCSYGKQLLNRKERGAVQKGLNLGDLETLEVSIPSEYFQNKIEQIWELSSSRFNKSKSYYLKAENYLINKLRLSEFELTERNINFKSLRNSFLITGRLDAEYYQPKFDEIIRKIVSVNHNQLKNLVYIHKSIEPGSDAYQDSGLPFYRVSNLTKLGLTQPDIHIDKEMYSEVIRPKKDTILLTKDGTVGMAYKVEEDIEGITSGAILHLNIKKNKKTAILPDYLTLVLNSKAVQLQAERDAGGSIIKHWKPSEIENVVIPLLDMESQKHISDLIQQSFQLKAESEQLLEDAKSLVEYAIEHGEDKAMKDYEIGLI